MDAELERVGLEVGPGGQSAHVVRRAEHAVLAGRDVRQQLAGRMQLAVAALGVLAQEHLMRRVGGVRLALVDERRDGVGAVVDVVGRAQDAVRAGQVGGPRQDHEVVRAALHVEGVVGQQGDEHRAAAALADEVEAMIEELAEQRHPGVERRGEAGVRRDVVDEQALGVAGGRVRVVLRLIAGAERLVGCRRCIHCRGVVGALIGDEIADRARRAVDHDRRRVRARVRRRHRVAVDARIGVEDRAVDVDGDGAEERLRHAGEGLVGRAEVLLAGDQVVVGAGNLPEAEGEVHVDRRLAGLGHLDLRQNEFQIGSVESDHGVLP